MWCGIVLIGSDLVKACVQYGTHYCDITGETGDMLPLLPILPSYPLNTYYTSLI